MVRAIDHLVVPSADLAGMAAAFRALGFTVGARNRHPWGTENHVVQFRSSFFELLGFADDFVAPQPAEPAYPFAGFLAQWVNRSPGGVAMTVLRSSEARADAASYEAMGIGHNRLLPFARSATGPGGADRTVAFTVAFAEAASMPEIGFFTCQQHRPENFWNPALQEHSNGATDLTGFVIIAEDPQAHATFMVAFSGGTMVSSTHDAVEIGLPGGCIEVATRAAFARRYGCETVETRDGPWIAAAMLSTPSLHRVSDWLRAAKLDAVERDSRLILSTPGLGGCLLMFEADGVKS